MKKKSQMQKRMGLGGEVEEILNQFLLEARPIWPMSQFAIVTLRNSILQKIDAYAEQPRKKEQVNGSTPDKV